MKRSELKRKKPLKRRGKTPFAKAQDRADIAWSKNIRLRANGLCERCGQPADHAHHAVSRDYKRVRYSRQNGVSLCLKDHFYWAHNYKTTHEFWAWLKRVRPADHLFLIDPESDKTREEHKVSLKRSVSELVAIAESFEADNRLYDEEMAA